MFPQLTENVKNKLETSIFLRFSRIQMKSKHPDVDLQFITETPRKSNEKIQAILGTQSAKHLRLLQQFFISTSNHTSIVRICREKASVVRCTEKINLSQLEQF